MSLLSSVSSLVFPLRCPRCGTVGAAPCIACAAELSPAPRVPPIPQCDSVAAAFRYDEAARALLLPLKYANRRDSVAFFAQAIAAQSPAVDFVCWVPTTAARARARGFDQAEVCARSVAALLGVRAERALRRHGTQAQSLLTAADRRVGPRYRLRVPSRVQGARVVLVDDIITTGSTMARAACCLRDGGALFVHARAIAWTPPQRKPHARPTR